MIGIGSFATVTHENRNLQLLYSGIPQGVFTGVLCAVFGAMLTARGLWPVPMWLAPFVGGAFGFWAGRSILRLLFRGSEEFAKQLVFPDATGTFAPQYSGIQALEAQGRFDEAVREWMRVANEHPHNPSPLLNAADLNLRKLGKPDAALELYEHVRRIPGVRDEHVRYASQKIIDIHLAPGGDTGRALVELRRFISAFPDGREAEGARAAIARLKAERDGRP